MSPQRNSQPQQGPGSIHGGVDPSHRGTESRKRPRSRVDEGPGAACDQCRCRKVRCDRQQPECSNCRKAGVACNQSSTLKRVNHTKQLRDDFSSVLDRLNDVDRTLGALTQLAQQLIARPCSHISPDILVPSFPSGQPVQPSSFDQNRQSLLWPSIGAQNIATPAADRLSFTDEDSEACRQETVELENGGERLYGHPAALTLSKSLFRQLARSLVDKGSLPGKAADGTVDEAALASAIDDPATQEILRRQLEEYPFNGKCLEPVIRSDHKPVTTPPRLLVDLFLESYLRNINVFIPIFDKSSLQDAIDAHYSGEPSGKNNAWALICTNIVVLGLGLDVRTARVSQTQSVHMNDDLIPSFLRNCDRAIANLDAFTRPSLANVQALLTLALAAREFYAAMVFEKVCQTACQVGRLLGLHRSYSVQNGSGESPAERERIFRVLYSMDKQRVFLTGQPCDLYLFDSDVQWGHSQPPEQPLSRSQRLVDAFDDMMRVWEELYLTLYSTRATTAGASHRARQAPVIGQLIEKWSHKFHEETDPAFLESATDPQLIPIQLELQYCYHVTQILVLRCHRRNPRAQQQLRQHARIALKLIADIGTAPLTTARLASLSRVLGNYPMVAFSDLLAAHLAVFHRVGDGSPQADLDAGADAELLRAVRQLLQPLLHSEYPGAYFARLHVGVTWALELLDAVEEAISKPNTPQSQPGVQPSIDCAPTKGAVAPPNSSVAPSTVPSTVPSAAPSAVPTAVPSPMTAALSNVSSISPTTTHSAPPLPQPQQQQQHPMILHGENMKDTIHVGAEMTGFGFYTPLTGSLDLEPGQVLSAHDSPGPWTELRTAPAVEHHEATGLGMDLFQGLFIPEKWNMA